MSVMIHELVIDILLGCILILGLSAFAVICIDIKPVKDNGEV